MKNLKLEMVCDMEEAKMRLIGIGEICLLLSERQKGNEINNETISFIGMAICKICDRYLDVERWQI